MNRGLASAVVLGVVMGTGPVGAHPASTRTDSSSDAARFMGHLLDGRSPAPRTGRTGSVDGLPGPPWDRDEAESYLGRHTWQGR